MIYYNPRDYDGLDPKYFGVITGMHDNGVRRGIVGGMSWCADNGMFTNSFREVGSRSKGRAYTFGWWDWLETMKPYIPTCKFVLVPDVVGDCAATLKRWPEYAPRMRAMGFPLGFAAQNGQESLPLPDDYDALFIGGSNQFKYSQGCIDLIHRAQDARKWVHVGRVNTRSRIVYCRMLGVDSVDGTHIIYAPDRNIKQLVYWMTTPILFKERSI